MWTASLTGSTSSPAPLASDPRVSLYFPTQDTLKQLQDFVSDWDGSTPSETPAGPEPRPAGGDTTHDATAATLAAGDTQQETLQGTDTEPEPEPADDPPKKRMKLDDSLEGSDGSDGTKEAKAPPAPTPAVCVVCLGVLQEYCSRDHAIKVRSNQSVSPIIT